LAWSQYNVFSYLSVVWYFSELATLKLVLLKLVWSGQV